MKNQSYFSGNLKFLRERKAQSQEKLSTMLGVTRSQLSAYEKGQTKNPTLDMMMKVSEYFKISLDILVKVDLTKVTALKIQEYESRSDRDIAGKELRVIVTTVNVNNNPNIEHVPVKAKAGYLTGYGDEQYISKLPVFSLPHLPKDRKFRSFPSEGDSMYPFPENAIVVGEYVDDWFSLKADVPCIVITRSQGIVFKLVSNNIKEARTLLLKSLNTIYEPYSIGVADVVEVWKYRCYIGDGIPLAGSPIEQINNLLTDMRKDIKTLVNRA
jgi:transcriptional regulator with XRE-family HTH domain